MRTVPRSGIAAALLALAIAARAQQPPPTAPHAPSAAPTNPAPTASTPSAPSAPPPTPSPPASATPPAPTAPPAASTAPPAPTPAPAPTPTPAPAPPAKPNPPAGTAVVHVVADYEGTVLELRDFDTGEWSAACKAPCDRRLLVDGADVRLRAPGMSDSNVFRIDAGSGTARLRVSGGSEKSRTIGLTALIAGIPVSLAGMGLFGYGRVQDKSGVETAGIVTLAVGGVLVLGSLPFLGAGRTSVRDVKGRVIAAREAYPSF